MLDFRAVAALLSSLVSELLVLLIIHTPHSSWPIINSDADSLNSRLLKLFNQIRFFLSSTDLAASLASFSQRKRKRSHLSLQSDYETHQLGQRSRNSRPDLSPDSFKLFFKMSSSTFEWLSGLLEPLLDCRDPPGPPLNLPAEVRLGIGLFRLATGSDYCDLACRFRVSESTARFCAKQLCRVLCTNFRFWLAFPTPAELKSTSTEFETLSGVPNCCGVIDCARFSILEKNRDCNVSEQHSIAAQIVVDSSSRILSIVAGHSGNKTNFQILESTTLYEDIQGGCLLCDSNILLYGVAVNQYLVGNKSFPLLSWLMPPFVDPSPSSSEEKRFNAAHMSMQLSALQAIASLNNWGVLRHPMEGLKTAVADIGACSILHNVLLSREDYSAMSDAVAEQPLMDEDLGSGSLVEDDKASVMRSALARRATEFWDLASNK